MDKVTIFGCREYDPFLLDGVIEQHFHALEAEGPLIKKGDRVVIKPNLVIARRPDEATTTHPEFVGAIVRAVRRRGGSVMIAESPGGPYTKLNLKNIYAVTGIEAVARRDGAALNLEVGWHEVPSAGGRVCSAFNIIDPVLDADLVISAAKLKTHSMVNYSGAVKNLFGVVPGLMKPEFHYRYPEKADFGAMIVDLCQTVKPALSFVDGIVCMEGNGPSGGTSKFLGMTAASRNPYALDLLCCSLIGMSAREVPTVSESIARGLCPETLEGVELAGDRAERFLSAFEKPEATSTDFMRNLKIPLFLRETITRLFTPRPEVNRKSCVGCGKCAESCPKKTITIENGKAAIHEKACIRCFCCQEMCPVKAIKIKKSRLLGW